MSEKRDFSVSRVLSVLAGAFLFLVAWSLLFGGMGLGMGLGIGLAGIGALVVLLFKLFFIVFAVALAVSIYQLAKRVLKGPDYNADQTNRSCNRCGAVLKPGWNCCPYCGHEI